MRTRILLAALVAASTAGVVAGAPWPAAVLALLAVLLVLGTGPLATRNRVVRTAVIALFVVLSLFSLGHGHGPFLLVLLPVAMGALRKPKSARSLEACRYAMILAMAVLAFVGGPASLAGALAATLLLAVLLPRIQAERMGEIERRPAAAPAGAAWTVPAVAVVAALLFFVLEPLLPGAVDSGAKDPSSLGNRRPRPGDGTGGGPGGAAAITGTRRVSIGDIGRLQRDLRPILEISVVRGGRPAGAEDLGPLFRSGALEEFDGTTWESRGGRSIPLRNPSAGFLSLPRRRLPRGEAIEQRLRFLSGGSDALFCLGMPTAIGGDGARAGILLVPRGEIRTEQSYGDGATFTIRSTAAPGEYAAVDDEDLSDARRSRLLAVPPDHDRAAALARTEVMGSSVGLEGRALLQRMESFLAKRCRYSLDIAPAGDATAVEAFLFDSRRGHCELFASAAAVMLRSLGVPARVVVGFRGGLYDDAAKRYTLRGADAHAWTEAWFEETGWVTFDPTPSVDPLRPDAAETADGGGEALSGRVGLFDRILRFDGPARRRAIASVASFVETVATNAIRGAGVLVLALAFALLAVGLLLRRRAPVLATTAPAARPPAPVPEAWGLLVERLSALGIRRAPTETGLELIRRAVESGIAPPESLHRLADAYAAERFGDRIPSEAARAQLRSLAEGVLRVSRAES